MMLYTSVMKIKDKLKADRPREKLARYGAERLSDLELLMAIIGSGNAQADVGVIARRVLGLLREKDGELTYSDLRSVVGLGEAKIPVILASLELDIWSIVIDRWLTRRKRQWLCWRIFATRSKSTSSA